ncbi:DUF3999 family protein [Massilia sp. NEAU-DD11]|uniref:DUF3999 family protein n=1 Tax=Massilia cellulosiltytica TaxID=2683234 RepID=A0A7X3G1P9_9BURK|nr:DUF3999 family protein [Telluria cellulosilytica]MVW60987.1 DUF3999 family protein [Telluria cellulosilytica]
MIMYFSYRARSAFLAWALCTSAAHAADTTASYSHALPLQVSGKQAVVQLRLPPDVYLHARSAHLADLRVFDSAGAPQPFALTVTTSPHQQRSVESPCKVFPIFIPGRTSGRIDDLQVRLSRDGTVVSVSPHPGAAQGEADVLAGFVLDLGELPSGATVSSLTLAPPPDAPNYSAALIVEASNDLQDWQPLAETTVSWLVNGRGESVTSNRIGFPAQSFRYARVRWAEGNPVEFGAITAQVSQVQDTPQQWDAVTLPARRADTGQDLVYTAPVAVPAERVGVVLRGQNVVLPATIGRYAQRTANVTDFLPLASATFYHLNQNGNARIAGDVAIPETHLVQWILRPKGAVSDPPDLRLRWRPATLVFVAGGTPPYVLAFGKTGATSTQLALGQVAPGFDVQDLARLETARTGQLVEQYADAADGAPAATAQRRLSWLWALLLCGVGALAWMAWRLVSQLKQGEADSSTK